MSETLVLLIFLTLPIGLVIYSTISTQRKRKTEQKPKFRIVRKKDLSDERKKF